VLRKRLVKTVFMILVGIVAGIVLAHLIKEPWEHVVNGFVLLSQSGLAFSTIELFGGEGASREQTFPGTGRRRRPRRVRVIPLRSGAGLPKVLSCGPP
jgi:hypothetical protein